MGSIPMGVPKVKPTSTHTHGAWVWVQTGMGTDSLKFTHGLPMSNTNEDSHYSRIETLSWNLPLIFFVSFFYQEKKKIETNQ